MTPDQINHISKLCAKWRSGASSSGNLRRSRIRNGSRGRSLTDWLSWLPCCDRTGCRLRGHWPRSRLRNRAQGFRGCRFQRPVVGPPYGLLNFVFRNTVRTFRIVLFVDKVANAVYIPNQAVFEKDGKLIAWVKNGKHFDARVFTAAKRSESTMVIAKGLSPGEVIALADPTVKKGDKKEKQSGAMGALPGGGGQ